MEYILYFIIGLVIWFVVAWLPQLMWAWILELRFRWKKNHAKGDDSWIYKL